MPRRLGALATSLTLHIIALAAVASATTTPRRAAAPAAPPRSMSVFVVPPSDDSAPPGLNPPDADEEAIRHSDGPSTVAMPGFTANIAKIQERATLLFPFLTPGLSLERFAIEPPRELRDTFRDPFAPARDARPRKGGARPPLALSGAALQKLLDEAWSRRDRWTPFQKIVGLADSHNPDAGRLPALLHAYHRQNGLQPYVDTSIRDPRLWTELGLAADHVEFIGFISRYVSEHPSTKAATELLFLLDQLAQANLDALVTLLDSDPAAALRWTREANPDAYALVADLRGHYARQLQRKGIASSDGIVAHYEKVRLAILSGIVRTTPRGYRASDARFLIGSIHWRQGEIGDALRAWRGMTVDPTDSYAVSIGRILDAVAAQTGGDRGNVDAADTKRLLGTEIDRILRAEHGRWIMFSLDRLQQFGFHFDTF